MVNLSTESMNKANVCSSPVARFFGMPRLNPWSFWMVSLVPLCELTLLTMTTCQELGRGTSTFVRVSPALGVFSFLMHNLSRMGWLLLGYECMSPSGQLRLSLSHRLCFTTWLRIHSAFHVSLHIIPLSPTTLHIIRISAICTCKQWWMTKNERYW